jgi:hypothetical protein
MVGRVETAAELTMNLHAIVAVMLLLMAWEK